MILADEPTSALDDGNCDAVLALLRAQAEASGAFEVLKGDPSGLYYRMRDAREVKRYDEIRWTGQLPQQPQVPRQEEEPARKLAR